jgi:YidC/Oxa1 family membrane protein insertase
MASQRIFLWSALALVLWLNYQAWMQDYHRPVPPPAVGAPSSATPATQAPALGDNVPTPESAPTPPGSSAPQPAATTLPATESAADNVRGDKIHVRTDVLDIDISLRGGALTRADLLQYPRYKNQPDVKVRLFNDSPAEPMYVFQSGLTAEGGNAGPDHHAVFAAPTSDFVLGDHQDELKIPLTWSNGSGVTVTKTFTFRRGSYAIGVDYSIDNQSPREWRGASYVQLLRQQHKAERSMFNVESYAFAGPALWDGTRYRKLKIDKEEDRSLNATVTDGWLASMQHHFVAAAVPAPKQAYQFRLEVKGEEYLFGAIGPLHSVPAAGHGTFSETVYVGPKLQAQLARTGPQLERVADYG